MTENTEKEFKIKIEIAIWLSLVIFLLPIVFAAFGIVFAFVKSGWEIVCVSIICSAVVMITSVICMTICIAAFVHALKNDVRCNSYDDALKDMLTKESKSDKGGDGAKKEQEGEKKEE